MNDAAYYDHAAGADPVETLRRRQLENPKEMARLQSVVDAVPAGARRVLDVGCGGGIALHLLAQQRPEIEAVGVELSPRSAEAGRSLFGVDIRIGSAAELPFDDEAFDVVLATELLEHLPHGVYDAARAEIARVTREAAIVTVPFRERRAVVSCPSCGCRFNPFYHLRRFEDADLATLLPGMRRTELHITWTRGFFPGVLAARRAKAALGWPAPFPRSTVCPQCGFRRAPATGGAAASAGPDPVRRVIYGAMSRVPRPRRPRWARAVYRPAGGAG